MVFLIHTELRCTVNHTSDQCLWLRIMVFSFSPINLGYWILGLGRSNLFLCTVGRRTCLEPFLAMRCDSPFIFCRGLMALQWELCSWCCCAVHIDDWPRLQILTALLLVWTGSVFQFSYFTLIPWFVLLSVLPYPKYLYSFYTVTLRNFAVPTRSFRQVISFGKRMWFTESHIVSIISFLLLVLFTQFILDTK